MSALADARGEVATGGWVGLPTRRALELQLVRSSTLTRPHALVAVYAPCFSRVADRWRRHWPDDNSPFDLVRWSKDLVEGRGGAEYGLKAALGRVATLGDDLQGSTEWDARVAWVAVGVARAALAGVGAADYSDDDTALDLEDYDPPSLAACIEADGLPVAQTANDRHRPFWQWWLDAVVEPLLKQRLSIGANATVGSSVPLSVDAPLANLLDEPLWRAFARRFRDRIRVVHYDVEGRRWSHVVG